MSLARLAARRPGTLAAGHGGLMPPQSISTSCSSIKSLPTAVCQALPGQACRRLGGCDFDGPWGWTPLKSLHLQAEEVGPAGACAWRAVAPTAGIPPGAAPLRGSSAPCSSLRWWQPGAGSSSVVSASQLPARSELPAHGVSQGPSAALGEGSEGLMQRRVRGVWEWADLCCGPGEGVPMEQRWATSESVSRLSALLSLSGPTDTFALPPSAVSSGKLILLLTRAAGTLVLEWQERA